MNGSSEFANSLRRALPALLLVTAAVSLCAYGTASAASSETPQLMFVQSAEDLKVDPATSTFRLVKVNQQTLYFSDRPQRLAGHLKMDDYLKEWTAKAGKDNFGANPPNAALSVYEPGQPDSTLVVVEITRPQIDGPDLIYRYKIINGTMPAKGGVPSLFIDWIGAAAAWGSATMASASAAAASAGGDGPDGPPRGSGSHRGDRERPGRHDVGIDPRGEVDR